MKPVQRSNRGLLARPEAAVLDALVARMPRGVTPDQLSAAALAGALMAACGFALVLADRGWLLLACAGICINWLGDSLDGRLARQRGPDRGMAGFILDNGLDMLAYLLFALGFALSGLVSPAVPFALLAFYCMLANLALARFAAGGVFDLSVGPVGTTELRVLFLGLAVLLMAVPDGLVLNPLLGGLLPLDLVSLVWLAAMGLSFATTLRDDVRRALAAQGEGPPAAGSA